MDRTLDRRGFLRRTTAAAFAVSPVGVLGCTLERQPGDDDEGVEPGSPRPILLPWGPDAVQIAAPPTERPVAYLSHASMRIWVDLDFRDRLQYALSAHLSVSTGHWRVPLPGDSPNIPIQAGDSRREFEEFDMREWDATIEPTEGDVRVLRGAPFEDEVLIECQPLSGGGVWFNADPLRLFRCGPPSTEICREELMQVGTAARYSDRDCTRPDGTVRLVTWASREPTALAGV